MCYWLHHSTYNFEMADFGKNVDHLCSESFYFDHSRYND